VDGHEVVATLPDFPKLISQQRVSDVILATNRLLEKRSLDGVMQCFEKGAKRAGCEHEGECKRSGGRGSRPMVLGLRTCT